MIERYSPSLRNMGLCALLQLRRLYLNRAAENYPLCAQNHDMTRLDANVNIPPYRQRLHRGATGDQMLLPPADVNLSEISLKDRLLDRHAPHVLRRGRRLRRNPKMHSTHGDYGFGADGSSIGHAVDNVSCRCFERNQPAPIEIRAMAATNEVS